MNEAVELVTIVDMRCHPGCVLIEHRAGVTVEVNTCGDERWRVEGSCCGTVFTTSITDHDEAVRYALAHIQLHLADPDYDFWADYLKKKGVKP